jgi:hypothetical protein
MVRDPSKHSVSNLGIFASLYTTHGADAHRFQRRVIQLASIVLFHAASESHGIPRVKKNVQLLMDRLIIRSTRSDMMGTPKLMPKSLRLITAVAAKPIVALLGGLGLVPAPTKRACSVTGLVTPFIVRSP